MSASRFVMQAAIATAVFGALLAAVPPDAVAADECAAPRGSIVYWESNNSGTFVIGQAGVMPDFRDVDGRYFNVPNTQGCINPFDVNGVAAESVNIRVEYMTLVGGAWTTQLDQASEVVLADGETRTLFNEDPPRIYHDEIAESDIYEWELNGETILDRKLVTIGYADSVKLVDGQVLAGPDNPFDDDPIAWIVTNSYVQAIGTEPSTRFSDVSEAHTFYGDIEWLSDGGITKGCNPPANDLYCPSDFVTRAQMATFLDRALGLPATTADFFGDDEDSVHQAAINRLAESGITKGCNPAEGNTNFCPNSYVTRGQMAAFLVRAFGYSGNGGGNLFVDDDGSIFEDNIDKLATAGVTRGCNPPSNDLFCPDSYVTRGQMAAFLHRALG